MVFYWSSLLFLWHIGSLAPRCTTRNFFFRLRTAGRSFGSSASSFLPLITLAQPYHGGRQRARAEGRGHPTETPRHPQTFNKRLADMSVKYPPNFSMIELLLLASRRYWRTICTSCIRLIVGRQEPPRRLRGKAPAYMDPKVAGSNPGRGARNLMKALRSHVEGSPGGPN
uniref:Putative secreted protein n=1 Tax=Ixodes ricinus TaxID=34613 RepID=A0A147BLJ0_IXORI